MGTYTQSADSKRSQPANSLVKTKVCLSRLTLRRLKHRQAVTGRDHVGGAAETMREVIDAGLAQLGVPRDL